jgi:hypothetical protein
MTYSTVFEAYSAPECDLIFLDAEDNICVSGADEAGHGYHDEDLGDIG